MNLTDKTCYLVQERESSRVLDTSVHGFGMFVVCVHLALINTLIPSIASFCTHITSHKDF